MPYLDVATFRARSLMPSEDVDDLEERSPGFVAARIAYHEGRINARLAKRYAVPFGAPVPEIVLGWLTDLVQLDCYLRRGFNPTSQQDGLIESSAQRAHDDIKEAADSATGLYDLPTRQDVADTAIARGGPFAYSEASPYEWTDRQREEVRR